jgi:hypothetical protein
MKTALVIIFLLSTILLQAQPKEATAFTGKAWILQSDEMKGLGTHMSLTDNTKLEFAAEGTWKSSEPMKGVKQGKWSLENNGKTLVMDFTNEKVSYLILN